MCTNNNVEFGLFVNKMLVAKGDMPALKQAYLAYKAARPKHNLYISKIPAGRNVPTVDVWLAKVKL